MVFLRSLFQYLIAFTGRRFAMGEPSGSGFRARFSNTNICTYQQAACFPLLGDEAQFSCHHASISCSRGPWITCRSCL